MTPLRRGFLVPVEDHQYLGLAGLGPFLGVIAPLNHGSSALLAVPAGPNLGGSRIRPCGQPDHAIAAAA